MSTTEPLPIGGTVEPEFSALRPAFEQVLRDSAHGGAALSILVDGRPVVDVWGGLADVRVRKPWAASTTSVFFSMTKGLLVLLVARLVDAGMIELDAPMARYWPEFAQAGKAEITVRQVMSHRAGLSYPVEDISRDDILRWSPVISILERQAPLWKPGTAHVYHALTFGWLVGEVVRRVTGLEVGEAFARYVARPSAAEAWIGVPADQLDRIAYLVPGPGFTFSLPAELPNHEQLERSYTLGGGIPADIAGDGTGLNDPLLQQAVVPAGLGIGTARAVATLFSAAIVPGPGTEPISAAVIDDMTVLQSSGEPLWSIPGMGQDSWGTGFNVPSASMPMLGSTSFGHGGAGGQLSFADRANRLGFAFLTNDLQAVDDMRVPTLLAALRTCLD